MEYKIKQFLFDDNDKFLSQLVDLQNIVYEGNHIFTIEVFRYWYLENPMGRVISFNAFFGDELAAHYACIPYKMMIEGRIVLGLLSMATVTHPNHRGNGLFKQLAKATYDYAAKNDYEFVIGVANANSFHGFMKYFPFTFVSKLDVKIGFGGKITANKNKLFSTYWDKDSLEWRLACVGRKYNKQKNSICGKFKPCVETFMGKFPSELISEIDLQKGSNTSLKLYVGLGADIKSLYFEVPKFIKHSPFNLIFLDLTGKLPEINKDNVFFQLIDFDVA